MCERYREMRFLDESCQGRFRNPMPRLEGCVTFVDVIEGEKEEVDVAYRKEADVE